MLVPTAVVQGGSSGTVLLSDTTLAGAGTFDVSGIPGTCKHLQLVVQGRATGAVAGRHGIMRFNNDSSAIYDCEWFAAYGTLAANLVPVNVFNGTGMNNLVEFPGASAVADMPGQGNIIIANYATTVFNKTAHWNGATHLTNDANGMRINSGAGVWKSTAAITRIQILLASSDTFVAGSRLTIYGLS